MPINEFKGYDKPQFDNRVKNVLQIENICQFLLRGTAVMAISVLIGLLFTVAARAVSIPDMFMVPVVGLTSNGAALRQPQTGAGYETRLPVSNTPRTGANGATVALPGGGVYTTPRYNSFATGSSKTAIPLPQNTIYSVDNVTIQVRNNISGAYDQTAGTTATVFSFNADVSGLDPASRGRLEYRWDFENDGLLDTYFSTIRSVSHIYSRPGAYTVRLEVLDGNGQITRGFIKVNVALNDAPKAYFLASKNNAPKNSVIAFDTSYSADNQYHKNQLNYRFDWNGDGRFDTSFQSKTNWNHLFSEPGYYKVVMEVMDPEGLAARAALDISIVDDNAPQARLLVSRVDNFRYQFDAGQSSDDFTELRRLKFRWDFDYNGPDDIIFDSSWSNSTRFTGDYRLGGGKTVRLQVMDEQGLVDESFVQIDVPWQENYVNLGRSS